MKRILLVCGRDNIDKSLRRSLTHLAGSCQVEVVSDSYQAYDVLKNKAFDLIIVDFEIHGIDSLELIESIEFIDPGIPIILMLQQHHKSVWSVARYLNANPILRPFKPLTFLRLVDTLLHQQLERYRDLSVTLSTILESLEQQVFTSISFLVDGTGQVLMSTGNMDAELVNALALLAVTQFKTKSMPIEEPENFQRYLAPTPQEKDHNLQIIRITDNLFLVLISAITFSLSHWEPVQVVKNIRQAFYNNAFQTNTEVSVNDSHVLLMDDSPLQEMVIPLKLDLTPSQSTPLIDPVEDEVAINWQIITQNTNILNRLQNILAQ